MDWVLALLVSGTLNFTLPNREEGDSCTVAQAPCTDLDSVFLWRQDAVSFPQPAIIKRAGVRGMEGQPWSFTYDCQTPPCQYYVVPQDINGNRPPCPPTILQVGGSTGVPPSVVIWGTPEIWFDVAGRRLGGEPKRPGLYWSNHRRFRVILL